MNFRLASLLSFFALVLTLLFGLGVDTRQSVAAPVGDQDQLTYLPYISKAPNLYITSLEVSQSIQDASNGVPLVANRPTVVRVFTATIDGSTLSNTSISLTATRGGVALASVAPIVKTASGASSRASLDSTYNFTLPASWLSGTVQITASVTGQNGGSLTQSFTFNTVPTLNVVLVPIRYTHTPTGQVFPGPTSDRISNWMMRAYPLSNMTVTTHPNGLNFSGNLQTSGSWTTLLNVVTDLKHFEIGQYSSTVYYAYVDFDCGWFNCGTGGIAGIGWIGLRASVGLDLPSMESTGDLAGHEIGHNFGRYHANCPTGGPSGLDPNYPYAGASIGEYGLDGIGGSLNLLSPSTYKDMMSYCEPVWVSDYTYKALYADQVAKGAYIWSPMQESLLISGAIGEDGTVSLNPVYMLPQTAVSPQNGLYEVQLLDAQGDLIASHPVDFFLAEEVGVTARAVHGVIPAPAVPVAELRLVEVATGTAVAHRTFSTSSTTINGTLAANATLAQRSESATVSWSIADVPANVRYTANDGLTWTTVGLNVLGGSLEVDLSGLPGGGNGRFQIILADQGTPTRFEVELPTPLSDKQPTAWISGSDIVTAGSPTALYAFGSDAEDGALSDFVWSVDGNPVAADSALFLHDLAPGEHVITLRATTSSGQTAVASQIVTVTP